MPFLLPSKNSKLGNFASSKENKHFPTGVHTPRIDEGTPTAALNGANELRLRLRGGWLLSQPPHSVSRLKRCGVLD